MYLRFSPIPRQDVGLLRGEIPGWSLSPSFLYHQRVRAQCPRYLRPAATRPIRDIHQKGSRVHQQNHVIPTPHSFANRLDRINYKQAWARSIALLLDDDGQVHIQVDATVEMEGAGSVEWSNGHTLTGSVELQVVDDRCTRFSSWFNDAIHPGAIANNV